MRCSAVRRSVQPYQRGAVRNVAISVPQCANSYSSAGWPSPASVVEPMCSMWNWPYMPRMRARRSAIATTAANVAASAATTAHSNVQSMTLECAMTHHVTCHLCGATGPVEFPLLRRYAAAGWLAAHHASSHSTAQGTAEREDTTSAGAGRGDPDAPVPAEQTGK